MSWETEIRYAAFRYLADYERFNELIPGRILAEGFEWKGQRITLKGQTGIWTPRGFDCPISITSRTEGPYNLDGISKDGTIIYAYRGMDTNHWDNKKLRKAYETRTPLIFFKEVRNHLYQAIWPVLIIEDHPEQLYVLATIDPAFRTVEPHVPWASIELSPVEVRRYAMVETRHRLHQSAFREIVIHAYDERCAMCNLHHPQLLDAAHIIPDSDDEGIPVVNNGLSLCKIHHAAFDCNLLGVDSDYIVHVQQRLLQETDGPMLQHGLKDLHAKRIILPRRKNDWPNPESLERKFKDFPEY
ncbi:MAG: HNH endonuclease [Sphaerochaetaceae bacterium]